MSIYHRTNKPTALRAKVGMLTTAIATLGADYSAESVNMQGLEPSQRKDVLTRQASLEQDITAAFIDTGTLSPAQVEAGVRAAIAASNPQEHSRLSVHGYTEALVKDDSAALSLRGAGGDISHSAVNMQAYEQRNFDEYKEASVEFNVLAASQDSVSELFFPSLNVSADAPTLRSTLRSIVVQRNAQHSKKGAPLDLGRKNLAHAFTNPEILENNSTTVVPVVAPDNSNLDCFVPAAKFAPYDINVDGLANKTAPLRIGKDFSLLGLAEHGTFAPAEGYDATDQLNSRAVLKMLLLEVSDGTNVSQISLPVLGLPTSNFIKDMQGSSQEDFILNFSTTALSLSKETKDVDDTDALALAGIEAGVSLRIKVKAHGELNLNTAYGILDSATLTVTAAYTAAGKIEITPTMQTAIDNLTFNIHGFELTEVTRTNSNRSSVGLWVESTSHTREFAIGAQAPIYHPRPVAQETPSDIVQALVAASRAVTTNNGLAAITNHMNTLQAYVEMGSLDIEPSAMFPGASDELVPYFKSVPLDIKAKLNSISTHEKGEDIRSLFSTIITHYVAQMINRSNYSTALEMARGTSAKPKVIIATDPEIAPWLMISGDADFLGRMVDYTVATTVHPDYKGKIIISFGSDTSIDGLDPLGFGRRGWITELLSTQETVRNGKVSTEVVIQPRELHAAVLPVGIVIDVTNLTEAVEEAI